MEKVYKVVGYRGNRMVSIVKNRDRRTLLTYGKGKITKPKFGMIFAFTNLRDAVRFAQGWLPSDVWQATTTRYQPIEIVSGDGIGYGDMLLRFTTFWLDPGKYNRNTMYAPCGTVVCPDIKLVGRLRKFRYDQTYP